MGPRSVLRFHHVPDQGSSFEAIQVLFSHSIRIKPIENALLQSAREITVFPCVRKVFPLAWIDGDIKQLRGESMEIVELEASLPGHDTRHTHGLMSLRDYYALGFVCLQQ